MKKSEYKKGLLKNLICHLGTDGPREQGDKSASAMHLKPLELALLNSVHFSGLQPE